MGNQRENNDELLFGLLSEKLYSHYCGTEEEHLSEEEEQAVINMMNSLQVEETDDFDPTSSFKRFCEKYLADGAETVKEKKLSSIEELLEEMESDLKGMQMPKRSFSVGEKIFLALGTIGRIRTVRRLVLAVLVVAVMFCGMNIGTYATAKMGFFEFLSKSDKGWSFMVTGEEPIEEKVTMDEITQKTYSSWEEVKQLEGMEDMMVPHWIPEGCELNNILFFEGKEKISFSGMYYSKDEEKYQVVIERYNDEIGWENFIKTIGKGKYYEENIGKKTILWYQQDAKWVAFFVNRKCSYYVYGEFEKETIEKIVEYLK